MGLGQGLVDSPADDGFSSLFLQLDLGVAVVVVLEERRGLVKNGGEGRVCGKKERAGIGTPPENPIKNT